MSQINQLIIGLQTIQKYDSNASMNIDIGISEPGQWIFVWAKGYKKEEWYHSEDADLLKINGWTFNYEYEGWQHSI